jgi:hypothetical protein
MNVCEREKFILGLDNNLDVCRLQYLSSGCLRKTLEYLLLQYYLSRTCVLVSSLSMAGSDTASCRTAYRSLFGIFGYDARVGVIKYPDFDRLGV